MSYESVYCVVDNGALSALNFPIHQVCSFGDASQFPMSAIHFIRRMHDDI